MNLDSDNTKSNFHIISNTTCTVKMYFHSLYEINLTSLPMTVVPSVYYAVPVYSAGRGGGAGSEKPASMGKAVPLMKLADGLERNTI